MQHLFTIVPIIETDRQWLKAFIDSHWGSTKIVTRGCIHHADQLPGYLAIQAARGENFAEGEYVGVVTFNILSRACEVITLDSLISGKGIGTSLLKSVEDFARVQRCQRIWLITTNDNREAIKFYLRRGYCIAAIHYGAISEARKLKPEIPQIGLDGIPIQDEIEFEKQLH